MKPFNLHHVAAIIIATWILCALSACTSAKEEVLPAVIQLQRSDIRDPATGRFKKIIDPITGGPALTQQTWWTTKSHTLVSPIEPIP